MPKRRNPLNRNRYSKISYHNPKNNTMA
ncbi:hypothetical protein Goklo_024595 [Gossypium klotzschianum]|uniref:Uncharacterized protein n=1 Tax=Gossypium klotzschianum TaxID=34286 RepID=A0A7J8WBD8_9ROSI|nr:hypothetical protein [Gossypium klotzschianum]